MTKGEIVDEIVIDANLVLQWPHGMSLDPQVDDDGLDAIGGIMYMPFGMMKKLINHVMISFHLAHWRTQPRQMDSQYNNNSCP